MRSIEANNLTLEPQLASHAAEMYRVLIDPAIYEFENEPPSSEAWLKARFTRLESRGSADGAQHWLNWVIRLPSGELAGYVQATVMSNGDTYIAYELGSKFWRRGIGSAAVTAMLDELTTTYVTRFFFAILKARNYRSMALLVHLGFMPVIAEQCAALGIEEDEVAMQRPAKPQQRAT